ncbi:MAG: dihydrofolate reductase family protein [Candidatus Nanopelagicales bacterium]
MRALVPDIIEDLSDSDLDHVYAWPAQRDQTWLRMNFAASIDGCVTDNDGLSAGVSSPDDKRVFALLRATCDAVLVGAGTARAEGYGPVKVRESMSELRRRAGMTTPPRLVIITNSGNLDPASSAFVEADPRARTIVVTRGESHGTAGSGPARLTELAQVADIVLAGEEHVDLVSARTKLANLGLHRLLCEGGPSLFGDMLTAGVVDDLCLTTSPLIAGQSAENRTTLVGQDALPRHHDATLASLVQANDSLLARWLLRK